MLAHLFADGSRGTYDDRTQIGEEIKIREVRVGRLFWPVVLFYALSRRKKESG